MPEKKRALVYEGSEVLQTEVKMLAKAYLDAFAISFVVQFFFLFIITELKFGLIRVIKALFIYTQILFFSSVNLEKTYTLCQANGICSQYPQNIAKVAYAHYLSGVLHYLAPFLLLSFVIYPVLTPIILKVFKIRAKKINEETVRRGRDIVTEKKLNLPKPQRLPITKRLSLPVEWEPRHVLITGKTGVGKTTLVNQMLQKLRDENVKKVIIYDYKGDFVQRFYQPDIDFLFNPMDARCLEWTIFNDIFDRKDIGNMAASLIPPWDLRKGDQFFTSAAQTLFKDILFSCIEDGNTTNKGLYEILQMDVQNLLKFLVEHNRMSSVNLIGDTQKAAGQAHGVRGTLEKYTQVFFYLSALDGDFSFTEWLHEKEGWIFLANRPDSSEELKPILSLVIDILARRVLALPDDLNRRVFFFVDELGTLQYLPSLFLFLTNARSKGGVLIAGIQDLAPIMETYSINLAKNTILNNFSTLVSFAVEGDTAEIISKTIGTKEVETLSQNYSFGPDDVRDGISLSRKNETKPIILASELASLKPFNVFVRFADGSLTLAEIPKRFISPQNIDIFVPSDLLQVTKKRGGESVNVENASMETKETEGTEKKINAKEEKETGLFG